jgi:phospholipid-transporting ATPase
MNNSSHENYLYIQQMLELLAVCHTVIVEEKNGKSVYNASSPDELALVNAAKFFGYSFKGRDEDNDLIIDMQGTEVKYSLLNIIEFTSARKRMSVIVKTPDDKLKVMCKGADSIIIPLLKKDAHHIKQTQTYLDDFSKEGLRTLVLAEKEVTEEFYQ